MHQQDPGAHQTFPHPQETAISDAPKIEQIELHKANMLSWSQQVASDF